MSGFSIDWLDLREDADRRARDSALREQAMQWLEGGVTPDQNPVVVDLGAGTGSTLRALAAPNQTLLTWRLVDNDATLLAEARHRHGATHQLEPCLADLASINSLPLEGARLISASALFDLVSDDFLVALATALQSRCQQSPVGIYAALNYDGSTHWTPRHPLDDAVLAAFNQDQRQDKGFGPALGPEAGNAMQRIFTRAGFEVFSASSPWVLDGADQHMTKALITGIAGAVSGHRDLDDRALKDWVRFRQSHSTSGTCTVGHTDLLALPR